jgi:uncharacterized protein (DUF433 family)
MKRTIELDAESERSLNDLARALGSVSEEEALAQVAKFMLLHIETAPSNQAADAVIHLGDQVLPLQFKSSAIEPIQSTPQVMGGDACVRKTRIPVWSLVDYKRQGLSDSELLGVFPGLNASDLLSAWDYYAAHTEEVDAQRRRHEQAA